MPAICQSSLVGRRPDVEKPPQTNINYEWGWEIVLEMIQFSWSLHMNNSFGDYKQLTESINPYSLLGNSLLQATGKVADITSPQQQNSASISPSVQLNKSKTDYLAVTFKPSSILMNSQASECKSKNKHDEVEIQAPQYNLNQQKVQNNLTCECIERLIQSQNRVSPLPSKQPNNQTSVACDSQDAQLPQQYASAFSETNFSKKPYVSEISDQKYLQKSKYKSENQSEQPNLQQNKTNLKSPSKQVGLFSICTKPHSSFFLPRFKQPQTIRINIQSEPPFNYQQFIEACVQNENIEVHNEYQVQQDTIHTLTHESKDQQEPRLFFSTKTRYYGSPFNIEEDLTICQCVTDEQTGYLRCGQHIDFK